MLHFIFLFIKHLNNMAKSLHKLGKGTNGVEKCSAEGYSDLACVVSQVAKDLTTTASLAGAGVLFSIPTPINIAGGTILAYNADTYGTTAEKIILNFCDKNEKQSHILDNKTNEKLTMLNKEVQQSITLSEFNFGYLKHQINVANENIQTVYDSTIDTINDNTIDIINSTKSIQQNIKKELNNRFDNIDNAIEYLVDAFEKSIKQNYKISDETVEKLQHNKKFISENNKLNNLIDSSVNFDEISKQRQIVNLTINDIKTSELELQKFNVMTNSCGQLCSSVASLMGNNDLANDISCVAGFACQMSIVYAGYSGFGPLACMGPYEWGIMAVSSIVGLASGLLKKDNGQNPMIGLYKMMVNIMESIKELKILMQQNFDILFSKLTITEKNIIKNIIDVKDINYEILDMINRLRHECITQFQIAGDSFKAIDQKLSNINEMILNETSSTQIREIGSFVSKIFYNQDTELFENHRSDLVSRLMEPYGSSHVTLIGNKFDENSLPILNLNSILVECNVTTLSKIKMDLYLKELSEQKNIYISQIMNMSQFVMDENNFVTTSNILGAFFNEYQECDKNVGVFLVEVEDSSIILIFSKGTKTCNVVYINVPPLYFTLKLSKMLHSLHFTITETNMSSKHDTQIIMLNLLCNIFGKEHLNYNNLIDMSTQVVNPVLNQSLHRTLLYLMMDRYYPTNEKDEKCARINYKEMNQLFDCVDKLQSNYMKLQQLSNPKNVLKLLKETEKSSSALILSISIKFNELFGHKLINSYQDYTNNVLVTLSKVNGFVKELTVSENNPVWRTGTHNDWWHNRSSEDRRSNSISGYWNENVSNHYHSYRRAVIDSALEIMNSHVLYVNNCLDDMRSKKIYPNGKMFEPLYIENDVLYQLPFYIFPEPTYQNDLILPLYKDLRKLLTNEIKSKLTLRNLFEAQYFDLCKLVMRYEIVNNFINITMYSVTVSNNSQIYTKVFVITLPFSFVLGGTTLTNSDGVFTMFCGGIVATDSGYHHVNHEHHPGSKGRFYEKDDHVYLPAWFHRKGVYEDEELRMQFCNINYVYNTIDFHNQDFYGVGVNILHKYISECIKSVFDPYLTGNMVDNVSIKIFEYLTNLRKIETWDFFTYNELTKDSFNEIVKNKSDIVRLLNNKSFYGTLNKIISDDFMKMFFKFNYEKHVNNYLNKFCRQINIKTSFDEITEEEITDTIARPTGHELFSEDLRESYFVSEMLCPYIVTGESTGEIVEKMAQKLADARSQQFKLLNYINNFSNLTKDEQKDGLQTFVKQLQNNVSNMNLQLTLEN